MVNPISWSFFSFSPQLLCHLCTQLITPKAASFTCRSKVMWRREEGLFIDSPLPAVKNMTLSTQRIHGLIPLSDLSLTQLYPTCLLRADSLSCFFPCLNPLFSFCYTNLWFSVLLNNFPAIVSIHPLCLWQCACLCCNHVPAIDRCSLCFLFPTDRNEREGGTSDWSLRLPSLNSLTLLYHAPDLFLVRTQAQSTTKHLRMSEKILLF